MENSVQLPDHVLEYYNPLLKYVSDNKGKSYEERYGSERALEILKKKSLSSKGKKHNYTPKVKGRTYEEIYGKEKALEYKRKISESNKNKVPVTKGKTFSEVFGVEKSKEIGEKISEKATGKISKLKGKTYIEIYGEGNAKRIADQHSKSLTGKPSKIKGKTWIELQGKEQSDIRRKSVSKKNIENRKNQIFPFKDSVIEKYIQSFLTEHNIQFQKHVPFKIGDTYHQVDILLPNNIVIEVDGCFWHQCEQCKNNKGYRGKTSQEIRDKYNKIYSGIESLGYRVIRIWGHEINKGDFSKLEALLT